MFRLISSSLYDQSTFYDRFYKDLRGAKRRIVIEPVHYSTSLYAPTSHRVFP